MKILKYVSTITLGFALVFLAQSCRDTKASPLPEFETAVTAFADYKTIKSFAIADAAKVVPFTYRWVSVDNLNSVSKIEFFVTLYEDYVDKEGNPRTAVHGTKSFKILEGGAVPANRVFADVNVAAADVYNLFKDAAFDYGKGGGKGAVFAQNGRTPAKQFTGNDFAEISWYITTADGRKFTEWSPAICSGSIIGANCALGFPFQ